MHVAELRLYPIKSCRGVPTDSATLEARGFAGDRRAMIVSPDGMFLTQRTHPKLAQIIATRTPDLALQLGTEPFSVAFSTDRMRVQVWRDTVSAVVAAEDVNERLSAFLETPVCLVQMDNASERPTDPQFGGAGEVSFADAFPYLITTTASLEALSETAGEAIPMERFRPNIVVKTDMPWTEDDWTVLTIGDQVFDIVKPCTRCVVTTLDQSSGEQVGQSTMQALIRTRARSGPWGQGVLFGVNAKAREVGGLLRVGMDVQDLS